MPIVLFLCYASVVLFESIKSKLKEIINKRCLIGTDEEARCRVTFKTDANNCCQSQSLV